MSAPLQVSGSPTAIEQGFTLSIKRGPGGGVESVQVFRGTPEAVLAKIAVCISAGATEIDAHQAEGSATARLTARFPFSRFGQAEVAESTLEIQFQDVTFPIAQNPTFIGLTSQEVKYIETVFENGEDVLGLPALLQSYLDLRRRGVDSYRAKLPVVTLTQTVSQNFPTALVVADTGKIFATDEVVKAVGSSILFAIPDANVGVVSGGGFSPGWMADTQVSAISGGKVQLIARFEYGLWADALYP